MSIDRRTSARVNVGAIRRNCGRMASELAPGSELCAVVKADGYGHGAVESARAAIAGGAAWLAVADAREGAELRAAGLTAVRVLVMGALTDAELALALDSDCDVVVWSEQRLAAVGQAGGGRVHVKLDTGMGRLGTRAQRQATAVAEAAASTAGVELAGLMTHFATADEVDDDGFFEQQLETFTRWSGQLRARFPAAVVHAANSAATLRDARAHFDMVRCGVSIYGMDPFGSDAPARGLEAALELSSHVAEVKDCAPGQSAGYGRRFIAERDTAIALVPIGYGDGWRRGLSGNADVLIDGARFPLVGTISMDSITVDVGAHPQPRSLTGLTATLLGVSGSERVSAEEVAARLHTINYEVTCGLTSRVRRVHHLDGADLERAL